MKPLPVAPVGGRVKLGDRLRAARQAQSLTIEQVAQMTGLTKGFISRVERDHTSPSVASLVAICQVLSVPVGSLFEGPEIVLVREGEGPRINLGGHGTEEHLHTSRTEPRVQVIHSRIEPGGHGGEDLYTLNAEVDVVHVLRGALRVRFASGEVDLAAGDTLTFPGREPHSWANVGDGACEVLWILAPAAWSGTV